MNTQAPIASVNIQLIRKLFEGKRCQSFYCEVKTSRWARHPLPN